MTTANVNITKVLLKRGNTVQNDNYTGVSGELTVDTQLKTLRVHDGVTVGGNAITALGAIGSYSNTNTAAYLASQSITSANIGAFQTFANSNAATQSISINSINANVGAYQTFANSNAATQTTEINSLRANITAANTAITNLTSNAAIQATLLDTLTGNAVTQSQVLDTLTSNAAAQATSLTTLLSNAVAQQTSLIDLVANAATQAQAIANVTGTYSNTNVAAYLTTVTGNILPSANVTYSLGSSTRQWKDLWVSNNTIYIGNVPITVSNGNLLVNGSLVTGSGGSGTDDVLRANVGAYQTFANSNAATQATSINSINANIGSFYTYANLNYGTSSYANANVAGYLASQNITSANIGGGQTYANTQVNSINANLGAYQTFANSNAATQATSINTFNANLGAYQTFANSNAATQATSIATLQTQVYANTNVNTYLSSSVIGSLSTSGNLTVGGNLIVNGNSTIINTASYTIDDNILQIADGNPADTLDLGFVGHRTVAGNLQHTGLVRDASAGNWRLFSNVTAQPGNTVDFTNAVYDDLVVGNISANIVKNNYTWTFGTNGTTTLPTVLAGDTSIGTAFNTNPPGHTVTLKHNGGVSGGSGGELKFDYGNAQIKVVKDAGTTQTWTFGTDGTTQFPNSLILAPVSQSITMQSDQYSQLMWENANLTVAPNMAINSNFYVAQNNATLDIGYRDGSGTQVIKSWYWNADGIMTLPTAGRINFDNLSISSDANVSAFYAPAGNVQLAAGIGDAQIVASSLSDSKIWNFGANANLTLPETGYLRVGSGIVPAFISSPAPIITGFSNISAQNFTFLANGVNILSTVGAGAYGNTQVASYLLNFDGDIEFTSSTAKIGNVDVITVMDSIRSPAYQFSNGTSIFDGITGGGGTTYTNANVVAMLAANSAVFVGNVGNVSGFSLQANNTQFFIGGNTVIASGNANVTNSTTFLHNMYFAANGTRLVRNTGAGVGLLSFDSTGFTVSGLVTVQTANATPALPQWIKANASGLFAPSGFTTSTMTASGTVAVNGANGITTTQTTFPLVNATATTINMGGAATNTFIGANSAGTGSNVFVGNTVGTLYSNLTIRARGVYNQPLNGSVASGGGYPATYYTNVATTGGSGTGMIVTIQGGASGYLQGANVTNPGTGYRNGDTITIPAGSVPDAQAGGSGASFTLTNYNPNYSGNTTGQADYLFGIDGNLTLPGNVTIAGVGSIRYANGINYASTVVGTYSNVNVEAYIGGNIGAYYAFANANAATQATSINTINANIGAYQTYANANVVAIQANLGAYQTYANATFTYGNTQANALLSSNTVSTVSTTGNITTIANLVATGNVYGSTFVGNVVASGNNTVGNLITTGNLYGNVVGTTGVYSGNVNINGVTTLTGNLGVNGSSVTILDSILGLHTFANLAAWTTDDGRDIGIRMHYYSGTDKAAFLGLENTTKSLQFIADATETTSNVTGTFGNVQFGSLLLSNATAATSTTTGALIVSGGIGAVGNIWQSGQHIISNATTSTSTTTGALVVTGGGGFGGNVFANNIVANVTPAVTSTPATGVGYIGMPQNATGSATLTIADAGKHIYITSTGQTITIPANSSVPYPIGTTIAFIAGPSATTGTIAITTDTMYLAGTGTTGSRTLAAYGMATAVKVAATTWFINGTGLT